MSVLALDLASNVGWASAYDGGKRFASGEFKLHRPTKDKVKSPRATRYADLVRQLAKVNGVLSHTNSFALAKQTPIAVPDPVTTVVVERHRGGMKTVETAEVLYGYLAIAEIWAFEQGLDIARINTTANKRHATGKGNANKREMIAAARKLWRGAKISGHDEADALHLLRAYFSGVIEK